MLSGYRRSHGAGTPPKAATIARTIAVPGCRQTGTALTLAAVGEGAEGWLQAGPAPAIRVARQMAARLSHTLSGTRAAHGSSPQAGALRDPGRTRGSA